MIALVSTRVPDPLLERIRLNHHQAIRELQGSVATLAAHPANLLQRQVLTGAGTYTPHPDCQWKIVRQIGGGGGGGGVGAGAGIGAAGGGNSGWFLEYVVEGGGGAYSCGAGGSAGATTPTTGGTGGDTTIVLGGVTYTAKGGTGGTGATKSTDGVAGPSAPASGSTAVDILVYGGGGAGFWFNGVAGAPGAGGESPLGSGGYVVSVGAGVAGTNGGGGSGGASGTSAAGGAGGAGMIVIDEYGP